MLETEQHLQEWSVEELNHIFKPLNFKERIKKLYEYFPEKEVLMTSSFGTKSIFLLHLLQGIRPSQLIYFINTTYHFPETIAYKNKLIDKFNLSVKEVLPSKKENLITQQDQWWINHPRMCCTVNKIAPLDPIVAKHKVWISGLMAYQTAFRSRLEVFEQRGDIIKFQPLVDIDEGEFLYHLDFYKLPRHPLEKHGYGSIGCTHCTEKGQGRTGRWARSGNTECGLHPNFFTKK
jgi:phosphoadenosine phosphosulfate reductase